MAANRDFAKKPTILVVEDETITAQHLRQILIRLGYEVAGVAADGKSALELAARTCPDLLLADVGLEGEIDGVEVASRARSQWNIPTVFLTAYSDPATMQRAKVTEPYGYLVKPFAEQDLHATIEIALQQKDLAASREQQVQVTAHMLGRTQEELSTVAARLFSAQEQERQRVARDLHDDIGQRIALLHIDFEKLWAKLPSAVRAANQPEFKAALGHITDISRDLRNLSHSLHPDILDHLGLEMAVRELCESFEVRHATGARFSARNVPAEVPASAALTLYRIVQESLQNVAKHARADWVNVALIGGSASIELSIRDDGTGFDARSQSQAKGLGLISMAQRAKLVGGNFEIQSHANGGTQIHVSVPLETAQPQGTQAAAAGEAR